LDRICTAHPEFGVRGMVLALAGPHGEAVHLHVELGRLIYVMGVAQQPQVTKRGILGGDPADEGCNYGWTSQ
jgi:hypothetical protein